MCLKRYLNISNKMSTILESFCMHIKGLCLWLEVSSSFRMLYLKGKKFGARIKFNY